MRTSVCVKGLMAGLALLALWGTSGCGHSFFIASPPGFVELEDQEPEYDYRSTNADGLVIGVREIKHKPKADQAFWVEAIRNKMRQMSGYALLESSEVSTKSGLKGTQMRFGHDEKGQAMLYYVTVFVTEKKIYLVEFGGSKEQMTKQGARLTWVLENFRQD